MNIKVSLFAAISFLATSANALELLDLPSAQNRQANKSVLLAMQLSSAGITLVGERGHIIEYKNQTDWQQSQSPTSVTLTDITQLTDGSQIAIGHDGIIIRRTATQPTWQKQFDGYQLTQLNITNIDTRIAALKQQLANTTDEINQEDLSYAIEDLEFAKEDANIELKDGPNKPLLSLATLSDDTIFAVGAYGTLLKSTDAGHSWQLEKNKLDNPNNFHLNAITTDSNDNLFIVGENATAFASYDKGNSWQAMELGYHGSFFGINADPQSDALIAYGLQGHIAISTDNGHNWQLLSQQVPVSLLGGTIHNGTAYLVGQGGVVVSLTISNPHALNIQKHPSGAIFSDAMVQGDTLLLSGQHGLARFPIAP